MACTAVASDVDIILIYLTNQSHIFYTFLFTPLFREVRSFWKTLRVLVQISTYISFESGIFEMKSALANESSDIPNIFNTFTTIIIKELVG